MLRTLMVLAVLLAAPGGVLGAQSSSLESDAQERARLEMRRYALYRTHLDRPSLPESAQAELQSLRSAINAINERYRQAEPGAAYQLLDRSRQITAAEIAPGWNRFMLERFPLPDRIRRDFPDDVRYAAALLVIGYEFIFAHTIRPPRTPELDARDALYREAREAVLAPHQAKGEQSREWRIFERDMLALTQSASFKREVMSRYLPLFASFMPADSPPSSRPTGPATLQDRLRAPLWSDELDEIVIRKGDALLVLVPVLLLLGGLVIPIWTSRRRGRRHHGARRPEPETAAQLGLPPDLQRPVLPWRLQLELFVEHARVLDLQTWSETTISWHSTGGGPHHAPPHVSVQSRSVLKDRLWVQTMEEKEEAWTLTNAVLEANRGHGLSWVQCVQRKGAEVPCLLFNHHTQKWYESPWLATYHDRFWLHWFLLNVLWLVPLCLAGAWLSEMMDVSNNLFLGLIPTVVVISLVWAGTVHAWTLWRRGRVWKTLYRPRLLEWLKSLSPGFKTAEPPPSFTQAS
jgi:hypothetical protein